MKRCCLRYFLTLPLLAASWGGPAERATAHEGPHPAANTDQTLQGESQRAEGFVFHDKNENGQRDPGEQGLADIRVSNGRDIVQTDAQGHYHLPIDDDQIVFVIKPRNWKTPVNEEQLPQFFYIHKPNGSPASRFAGVAPTGPLPESIDFPLMPSEEPNQFKAIMFGDPQPRNVKEVDYIAHDIIDQNRQGRRTRCLLRGHAGRHCVRQSRHHGPSEPRHRDDRDPLV